MALATLGASLLLPVLTLASLLSDWRGFDVCKKYTVPLFYPQVAKIVTLLHSPARQTKTLRDGEAIATVEA